MGFKSKLALLSLAVLMAVPAIVVADHPSGATPADIRRLQVEADLLDDSMQALDSNGPRAREFRRRETELRDQLASLNAQVRQHQRNRYEGLGASKAEVEELQRAMLDLRNDVDQTLEDRGRYRYGTRDTEVPDGTDILVRLDETLSSRTARREDRVEATVAQSIRSDRGVVIPAGTTIVGHVTDVEPARRPAHGGRLSLSFDQLVLNDGRRVDIQARVVDLKENKVDKSKAGLGALAGGVLGAIFEGKKGALVGGLVGGGGAVVALKGDEVTLPAGSVLTLRLDRPVRLGRR